MIWIWFSGSSVEHEMKLIRIGQIGKLDRDLSKSYERVDEMAGKP